MDNKNKCQSDLGFTIIELTVVLFIVGIIVAIVSPNYTRLLGRIKVDNSLEMLLGAIRESQRLAMRKGKVCRLNINYNANILTGIPKGCLLGTRNIDKDVTIRTNIPGMIPNISFSHKGNTTKMGTIVLSSNVANIQKCFVISLGLGIMRSGNYTGSPINSVSSRYCQTE